MDAKKQRTGDKMRGTIANIINKAARDRETLEKVYPGEVWDTAELIKLFEVIGFLAPFCKVRKLSTGEIGTVTFQHHPRFYFKFVSDEKLEEKYAEV